MDRLSIVESGLVYRNPVPHLFSRHAYYPSVIVLPNGTMLASFVIASAMESTDGQLYLSRSVDQGRTWTEPCKFHEKDLRVSETGRITHTGNGHVVMLISASDRPDPHIGSVNPVNLGHVPNRMSLHMSDSGGERWEQPCEIKSPLVGPTFELCSPIVILSDGRWLLPTSTWRGWNGDAPNGMKAVAFISDDQGATWPRYVDVMDGTGDNVLFWEQKIIEINRDRLLAVSWAYHEPEKCDRPNHFALASRESLAFSPALPTALTGQTPELLHLGEGLVLCVYRRVDEPGLWAALVQVTDDGAFDVLEQQCLWQPMSASTSGQHGSLVEEFRGLKFGAPCMKWIKQDEKNKTDNKHEVYLAFWCMEGCVSNIRWIRLRVPVKLTGISDA